jgi:hypothetical protein
MSDTPQHDPAAEQADRLPEIPEDATDDERRWIKRQISEGGPVPVDDDPAATRTLHPGA